MALNVQLKKMAEEAENVTFIDLNIGLTKNSLLDSKYSGDGVHLNGKGYGEWKNLISEYLK